MPKLALLSLLLSSLGPTNTPSDVKIKAHELVYNKRDKLSMQTPKELTAVELIIQNTSNEDHILESIDKQVVDLDTVYSMHRKPTGKVSVKTFVRGTILGLHAALIVILFQKGLPWSILNVPLVILAPGNIKRFFKQSIKWIKISRRNRHLRRAIKSRAIDLKVPLQIKAKQTVKKIIYLQSKTFNSRMNIVINKANRSDSRTFGVPVC